LSLLIDAAKDVVKIICDAIGKHGVKNGLSTSETQESTTRTKA